MKKENWLITIDLDGTMLNDGAKNDISFAFHPENKEAIIKAQEAGHVVSIVTGRPWRDTKKVYEQLDISSVVSNYNGAYLHKPDDEGFVLQEATLNRQLLKEMVNSEIFFGRVGNFVVENKEFTFVSDASDEKMLRKFHVHNDPKLRQLNNIEDLDMDPYSAIFKVNTDVDQEAFMQDMNDSYGDAFALRYWGGGEDVYLEINSKAIHKGRAMETIAAYYNIPMERTISFGDGPNDLEMLSMAKRGVAMINASDNVKTYADDITEFDNNDAGVGRYLIKFLNL